MDRIRSALGPHLRGEDLIVALFTLLLIYYGASSFFFETVIRSDVVGPAFFPQLIAASGLILCTVYFLDKRRKGLGREQAGGVRNEDRGDSDGGASATPIGFHLVPLALIVAYAMIFEPLGFPLATLLYITLTMRYLGQDWLLSVVSGAVMTVLIFSLFYLGLMADIPLGKILPTDDLVPYLRALQRMIHG
jgi:putative tricarboxylic transport membrane protein